MSQPKLINHRSARPGFTIAAHAGYNKTDINRSGSCYCQRCNRQTDDNTEIVIERFNIRLRVCNACANPKGSNNGNQK